MRGRDARARRRVGLRQVDDGPGRSCSSRRRCRARVTLRRRRAHRAARRGAAPPAAPAADDLPGPDLVAEPAAHASARSSARASTSGRSATKVEPRRQGRRGARRGRHRPGSSGARRPHEFSGGQCQRISIARAVVTDPKLIICDEPVSALDVSVQAQILNLLEDMKHRYGLTLVFIAHDLAVVKNVSDRVLVMYLGKICEVGAPRRPLRSVPSHPYTAALLAAIPVPDPAVRPDAEKVLGGEVPVADPPAERLPVPDPMPEGAGPQCVTDEPEVRVVAPEPLRGVPLPARGRRAARLRPGRDRSDRWTRRPTGTARPAEGAAGGGEALGRDRRRLGGVNARSRTSVTSSTRRNSSRRAPPPGRRRGPVRCGRAG